MNRALPFLAFLLIAGFASRAPAQVPLPKFEALVTDLTGTLTAQQQASLDEKLTQFQARKGAQIAVLMLPSTAPEDIAQFGIRLAESWKVGRKGTDDGLILIVAKDDRALRFEVGYGLEGTLPDALAGRIINETITPLFKQGDFYGGINAGLDQAIRVIDGEPLPAPDQGWATRRGASDAFSKTPSSWIFFGIAAVAGFLRHQFGRGFGALGTAVLVAVVLWFLSHSILLALGIAFLMGLVVLAVNLGPSRGGWSSGGGGWGGGGSGGGFGGGGGFSGGGGGSFGGGGASGRW